MNAASLKAAYKKKIEVKIDGKIVPPLGNFESYAFGYTRISTKLQLDGHSLDHQDHQINDYCKKNNLLLIEIFTDAAISGANAINRLELQRMISLIQEGIVVIVSSVSRLSRNTEQLLEINRKIKEKKGSLKILDLAVDLNSSQGECLLTVLGSFVTLERTQSNARISLVMNDMSKHGTLIKKPKYGYRVVNRKYVEEEKEQAVITCVKILLKDNPDICMGEIIRELTEANFLNKKGNPFHISTIQSIIREIQHPTIQPIIDNYKSKNDI